MVAGTAAGVGKTLVTTEIVKSLRSLGIHAVAMKPVARGHVLQNGTWYSDEMRRLADASAFDLPPRALCGHWLADDYVPEHSVRPTVSLESIVDTFQALSTWADLVVVEDAQDLKRSAGDRFDGDDLARELKLPVVLVVGMQPGCAQVALARVNALARGGLECAGWIANQFEPQWRDEFALRALEEGMRAPCLGSVPWLRDDVPASSPTGIDVGRILMTLAR